MTRKEPTGSGPSRRHGTRGHTHTQSARGGHAGKRQRKAPPHSHTPAHTHTSGQTPPHAERSPVGSAWGAITGAGTGVRPLLALDPAAAPSDILLAEVGAEQAALHDALQAWTSAQGQTANRIWRRPGGLTRMAGL